MLELLQQVLRHLEAKGVHYADVRYDEVTIFRLTAKNENIETVDSSREYGAGIRVLYEGSLGFASTNNLAKEGLLNAADRAFRLAEASTGKTDYAVKFAPTEPKKDSFRIKVKKDLDILSLEEIEKLAIESNKVVKAYSNKVRTALSSFARISHNKIFLSSEGAELHINLIGTAFSVNSTAMENGKIQSYTEDVGGTVGLEEIESVGIENLATKVAECSVELLKARLCKAGRYTVIVDPLLTGLLTHESFGHLTEGDHVIAGSSPLKGRKGQRLGPEMLTIVDDGTYEKGLWAPYDDEGTPAERTVIVEGGVLKKYLNSRESAFKLGEKPTGNGRAQDYSFLPIVRMRNTYIAPGDFGKDELFEDVREGIYAVKDAHGQSGSDGTFFFRAARAYEIKNGELQQPLTNVALTGNILEYLKNIDAVADDLKIDVDAGFGGCLSGGQRVYVGLGGPHIRIRNAIIGGR
jgi:TldD protein